MVTEIGPGSFDAAARTAIAPDQQSTTAFDSSAPGQFALRYVLTVDEPGAVRIDTLQSAAGFGSINVYGAGINRPVPDTTSVNDGVDDVYVAVWPGQEYLVDVSGFLPPDEDLPVFVPYASLYDIWENALDGAYPEVYPSYENDFLPVVAQVFPGQNEEQQLASFNNLLAAQLGTAGPAPGEVNLTVRFSGVVPADEPYPGGGLVTDAATEDFEGIPLGRLQTNFDPIDMPGWTTTDPFYGSVSKGPMLLAGGNSANAFAVTDFRSHSGSKSVRHSEYNSGLQEFEISRAWLYGSDADGVVEASCWHYYSEAFALGPNWSISNNGVYAGTVVILHPGALDSTFVVNHNRFGRSGYAPPNGHLRPDRFIMNTLHLYVERTANSSFSPDNVWLDTGVVPWDRWIKQSFTANLYLGTLRWELHDDEDGLLWSHEMSVNDFPVRVEVADASFQTDANNGVASDAVSPDWLDDFSASVSRWTPQFTFPPFPVEVARRPPRLTRMYPVEN